MTSSGDVLALLAVAGLAAVSAARTGSAVRSPRKIVGWTEEGDPIYEIRKRRSAGRAVNPTVPLPRSPGPWVDEVSCACGATYHKHRSDASFPEAALRLRHHAGGHEGGGGYRSRGPILHMMRVMKLSDWYQEHYACGVEWEAQQRYQAQAQAQRRQLRQVARRQGWEPEPEYEAPPAGAQIPF